VQSPIKKLSVLKTGNRCNQNVYNSNASKTFIRKYVHRQGKNGQKMVRASDDGVKRQDIIEEKRQLGSELGGMETRHRVI